MSEMLMEDYIREQINKGQYGVIVIPISTAEDIAYYIETSRDKTEPVRHGQWTRDYESSWGDSRFMCSVCHCKESVPTCNGEPTVWDYCPNCGAKMEEEK